MSPRSKYCIIGIPDHQGVFHVGGRMGAARGPAAFRAAFLKMNDRENTVGRCEDRGNVAITADIVANHRKAAEQVAAAHTTQGTVSVVIGGGHDHGYSHLLGVSKAALQRKPKFRLGCINIDAHLDLRKPAPLITSGSPFYLAVESGVLNPKRFVEFGIQSHCNGPALWQYAKTKKISIVGFEKLRHGKGPSAFSRVLRQLSAQCDGVVVSLDLDAAAAAFAPGVSAPQAEGFSASELIEMAEIAGAAKKVVSLGLFELNPEHDPDGRTARLAATAAFHFFERAMKR